MNTNKRYLVCITRSNGDFHQYHLTDDVNEAVDKYIIWRDKRPDDRVSSIYTLRSLETRGISNHYTRPHLFLIDLTFTDDMVLGEKSLASESHLIKYKRIKRLYQLNVHLI